MFWPLEAAPFLAFYSTHSRDTQPTKFLISVHVDSSLVVFAFCGNKQRISLFLRAEYNYLSLLFYAQHRRSGTICGWEWELWCVVLLGHVSPPCCDDAMVWRDGDKLVVVWVCMEAF